MKLSVKLFTFLACFTFNDIAFSRPVSIVYRADSRAPSDVFLNGFHAWGTNINFNSHVLGISGRRGSRDSAFIPTTSSSNSANRFAIDLLNVSEDRTSYTYSIRATNNFYSALDSMYHVYDTAGVRVPELTRATLAAEQEYSAYQHIPAQLIQSVTITSRAENGTLITRVEENPNYAPDTTHSNEDPFTYGLPYPINISPILIMGSSMANINNEMPNNSAILPSPSYTLSSLMAHSEL
jgi:pertussis toxin subunit 1